jgi:hypothetical protein
LAPVAGPSRRHSPPPACHHTAITSNTLAHISGRPRAITAGRWSSVGHWLHILFHSFRFCTIGYDRRQPRAKLLTGRGYACRRLQAS